MKEKLLLIFVLVILVLFEKSNGLEQVGLFEFENEPRDEIEKIELDYIVGGTVVSPPFKYPFMAGLKYRNGRYHFCGGSLVHASYILTAAHCSDLSPSEVQVEFHRHDLTTSLSSERAIVRNVVRIIRHPSYGSGYNNDIALWKLDAPVNLPVISIDRTGIAPPGTMLTVIGWGTTREGGSLSSLLRQVQVPTISNSQCSNYYSRITSSMICAGYTSGGKDSCQGDSGGPLFTRRNDRFVQVGIVSWGSGCARPNYPGVYARLSVLYSFVDKTIGGREDDSQPLTPCSTNADCEEGSFCVDEICQFA